MNVRESIAKYRADFRRDLVRQVCGYDSVSQAMNVDKDSIGVNVLYDTPTVIAEDFVMKPEDRKRHSVRSGASQYGKSKEMEGEIIQVLDTTGCLVVDPAGPTYHRILAECAARNKRNVLAFNFSAPDGYFVSFDPLKGRNPVNARAGLIADAVTTAWGEAAKDTPSLTRYMSAIFSILVSQDLTLIEAPHLYHRLDSIGEQILEKATDTPAGRTISELHSLTAYLFQQQMLSTANRLNFTLNDHLRLILGERDHSIDLPQMVRDKWVILINANPGIWAGRFEEALIATSLLLNVLLSSEPVDTFPLFIDEIGYFGTSKLKEILALRLKEGFVLHVAHQYLDQLKRTDLLGAVMNCAQTKIIFRTSDPNDEQYYTRILESQGFKSPKPLSQLEKQEAVIISPGYEPKLVIIPTIPPVSADIDGYLNSLYAEYDFYRTKDQIEKAIEGRRRPPDPPNSSNRSIRRGNPFK